LISAWESLVTPGRDPAFTSDWTSQRRTVLAPPTFLAIASV
jgi:hypothetical protein